MSIMMNEKIGFIFGSGLLPYTLLDQNKEGSVCALLGEVPANISRALAHRQFDIGQVGAICKFFRQHGVRRICIAGGIPKPKSFLMKVDAKGFVLMFMLLRLVKKGDDAILTTVQNFLHQNGFDVAPSHEIVPNLFASLETKARPNAKNMRDVSIGMDTLKALSDLDIGQSCVVSGGNIIAIEAAEGTAEMVRRSKNLVIPGNAVLIKAAKVGQNMKLDVPSIGPDTIDQVREAGFAGLALSSAYVLAPDDVLKKADEYGIFVINV